MDGAELSERCDVAANLARKGCGSEFIEHPEVDVKVNATLRSTQVSPGEVSITLRPGSEASFIVAVQQLERYPVDLYYLVDVSASMQENLDQLKTVGVALSHRMKEHSSDLRLGFGSFVDKPVSPYINVHPSKIDNPCSDYETWCRPAHGFHHILSMTGNMSEFTRVIQHQMISGNMDTPEGGLDAMLQATVCQREIGWRSEAKRLLLMMTDQPSHLALDSRLGGIVMPHDGRCHLEDNVYVESTTMDHPSVGQLAEKLLENDVYSIFAVETQQYQWYEELVSLLPGSYLGKLMFPAPNLIELVVDAYKRLLSDVEVSVSVEDRAVSRFWVNVTPLCPNGSVPHNDNHSCSAVQPNQTVYFNITIGLRSCPVRGDDDDGEEEVLVTVKPVGYNESTVVKVRSACRCRCGPMGHCRDDASQELCGENADQSSQAPYSDQSNGEQSADQDPDNLEPDSDLDLDLEQDRRCRAEGSEVDCSGRGVCDCGRCVCHRTNLGTVYGKHCEMDDFSCPYDQGLLCGARGVCVLGECVCAEGWAGDSCGCSVSTATCVSASGLTCSGRGACVCGRCVCDDARLSGSFCERCPTCHSTCQSYWRCVDCHLSHGLTQEEAGQCNHTCAPLVGYVDEVSGLEGGAWRQCVYTRPDSCHYRFQTGLVSGRTQLHISTHPDCVSGRHYMGTFVSVCVLTVFPGLVLVAVLWLLLQRRHRALWTPGGVTEQSYNPTGKDLSFVPTINEKTVTYRRDHPPDRPVEMHIHVPRMPLGDPWQ